MTEPAFECPTCHVRIVLKPGGWPFLYSQAFVHLTKCGLSPIECDRVSGEIADRIYGRVGEK